MTREQRGKILLEAWAAIARTHRPDMWALRHESPGERETGTKFRNIYMWPDINV